MVYNRIAGDSRVIKTAQSALNAGYRATIVGVTSSRSVEKSEVEGVPVVFIPNPSGYLSKLGLWGDEHSDDLRLLLGLYNRRALPHILELEPDLIHSHDMIGLKIGVATKMALLASGHDIPWVHDLHELVAGLEGFARSENYKPVCLGWEREYLDAPDRLTTVSDLLAEKLERRYGLREQPQITYNVPVAGAFSEGGPDVRTALGLAPDVPLAVFVGGGTPLRGCDVIVDACARIEGLHLVFVSQGKYVDEMKQRAKNLGFADRFHTHPFVASDQVTSFIRTADFGIHGLVHYGNAEVALPNKMFEYLHANLPMVLSDVASMKSFMETHRVGATFEAGNVESCESAIRDVLANRVELRSRIAPELKSAFSWEQQEKKIQKIYAELLEGDRTSVKKERRAEAARWEAGESTAFESIFASRLAEVTRRSQIKQEAETRTILARLSALDSLPAAKLKPKSKFGRFMEIAEQDGLLEAVKRGAARAFG